MITFLFIAVVLIIGFFIRKTIEANIYGNSVNHGMSEMQKNTIVDSKMKYIGQFLLFFVVIGCIYINFYYETKNKIEETAKIETASEPIDTTVVKTESTEKVNDVSSNYSNYQSSEIACTMAQDFIKSDLFNPATADFDTFDCSSEQNSDGSYSVMRKVTAQNDYGVKKEYIYKVVIGFNGGDAYEKASWQLISIRGDEYRP